MSGSTPSIVLLLLLVLLFLVLPEGLFFCQIYNLDILLPLVTLGVLPKKLFLSTGSDLDMIYNLDILLPLDTLGVLPVLLLLVSGSTPGRLIFCQWDYSRKSGIVLLRVLPTTLFLYSGSALDMI